MPPAAHPPPRTAAASHSTGGRAPPSRAGGHARRRTTPPPFRSSPNGGRGASPHRGAQHDRWFSPLKPISTYKEQPSFNQGRRGSPARGSPTRGSPLQGRRSNSPGSPGHFKVVAPPPRVDSSDEEGDEIIDSSSDDGTGTIEQQDAKKARRERRRQHREFIRKLRLEKKEIHNRVNQAIFRCDDVLNDDLATHKEVAQEVRESVSAIIEQYVQQNGKGLDDLIDIKTWFSRVESMDKAGGRSNKPAVDLHEFEEGENEINKIVMGMITNRDTVEHKAHLLIDVAAEMVNNDESKQRLHEQQVRFVEEVNTLVKSLERVESHAKGLTQNNMDLRLQLKQAQDEALTWKRKFSKIEGTKDSMVRQMEAAILQRTQALKSTMSGAEGNEMSAMMDQITRMQEEKFEFNEIIAKLRREVLDEKVKTQKAEETIKSMGEDMVDLRQAAGPTADLIANLKEQVEIAKRGELQLRKDLHAAKNQIKRLNGGVVEAGDDLPVVFERGIQCVLIGNTSSEEGPYVCASCGGKGDAGGGEKTDAKETKAEEGSKKAAPKEITEEEMEAEMADKDKIKSMERRIKLLKTHQDKLSSEQEELKKAAKDKETRIAEQTNTIKEYAATIDRQQAQIQKMLDTNEGQRIMLDEALYSGKGPRSPLPTLERPAKDVSASAVSASAVSAPAGKSSEPSEDSPALAAGGADKKGKKAAKGGTKSKAKGGDAATPAAAATAANAGGLEQSGGGSTTKGMSNTGGKANREGTKHGKAGPQEASKGGVNAEPAPTDEGQSTKHSVSVNPAARRPAGDSGRGNVERTPSQEVESLLAPDDPHASEHAKALKRVCTSAFKFHEQVTKHIVGSGESGISRNHVSSILSQGSVSAEDGIEFVGHVFETLADYLGTQWSEGIDNMAAAMNQGKAIAAKETGEAINHMVKTQRLVQTKHVMRDQPYHPPAVFASLEARIEEQKERWLTRKAELREAKAKAIMSCMDAVLRVISVNFKVQIAPGVVHDIKGHMYTSLLDKGPVSRSNIVLGAGLDNRPGTRILTPRSARSRPPTEHRPPTSSSGTKVFLDLDGPERVQERLTTPQRPMPVDKQFDKSGDIADLRASLSVVSSARKKEGPSPDSLHYMRQADVYSRERAPLTAREARAHTAIKSVHTMPGNKTMALYNLATPRSGFSSLRPHDSGFFKGDSSPDMGAWSGGLDARRSPEQVGDASQPVAPGGTRGFRSSMARINPSRSWNSTAGGRISTSDIEPPPPRRQKTTMGGSVNLPTVNA